jgi:hypothetical protein
MIFKARGSSRCSGLSSMAPGVRTPHAGLDGAGVPESQATALAEAVARPARNIHGELASIAVQTLDHGAATPRTSGFPF